MSLNSTSYGASPYHNLQTLQGRMQALITGQPVPEDAQQTHEGQENGQPVAAGKSGKPGKPGGRPPGGPPPGGGSDSDDSSTSLSLLISQLPPGLQTMYSSTLASLKQSYKGSELDSKIEELQTKVEEALSREASKPQTQQPLFLAMNRMA